MSALQQHETTDPHESLSSAELHEHHVHVTPFWPMFWVFAVLLALTAITVWTSNIHDITIGNTVVHIGGTLHVILALTIATVKAVLVAAYFMHLKYDTPMNTVVVGATIFAVSLFIGLTLHDSARREKFAPAESAVIVEGGAEQIVRQAIENAHQTDTNPDGSAHASDAEAAPTPGAHE